MEEENVKLWIGMVLAGFAVMIISISLADFFVSRDPLFVLFLLGAVMTGAGLAAGGPEDQ